MFYQLVAGAILFLTTCAIIFMDSLRLSLALGIVWHLFDLAVANQFTILAKFTATCLSAVA